MLSSFFSARFFYSAFIIGFLLISALDVGATAEYALETGKSCSYCHINPAGGGELTMQGLAFRAELQTKGLYKPLSGGRKVIRFIIGYLHMFTAIIWFGTILYVHIVLKPVYAAGGLPRGELKVAWISMPVLAITGTLLAIARIPDVTILYTTRFGILLLIKIFLFLIMVISAIFVTVYIGPRLKKKKKGPVSTANLTDLKSRGEMTAEELSGFDGKEGRPALIALEGKVYDVSGSKLWKQGVHLAKHFAGRDLTLALKGAPHGPEKITALSSIAKLVPELHKKSGLVRLFYFLAYMNLVFVFLIIFVISLWRWW